MQTVTVIALKDFIADNGRDVHKGEAVMLTPIEVAVRGHHHEVSLDPMARATYATREMTASTVQAHPAVPIAPEKPTRRRRRKKALVS